MMSCAEFKWLFSVLDIIEISSAIVKHAINSNLSHMRPFLLSLWGLFIISKMLCLFPCEPINNLLLFHICSFNKYSFLCEIFLCTRLGWIKWPLIMATFWLYLHIVWLTYDRWLVYSSRHRWTVSLNLSLSPDPSPFSIILIILHLCIQYVLVVVKLVHLHPFSAGLKPLLSVRFLAQLWDPEAERCLTSFRLYLEFLHTHAHTNILWGWSMERWVKRFPRKHLCVSEIRGWEWAGKMRTEGEDEAVERVKKVITEGRLQRKWHREARWWNFFSIVL